jgi:hypothetical protein
MAWIKTIPLDEAEGKLLELLMKQQAMYRPNTKGRPPM